ncbi:DMT family transporter [Lutimaribacter sp. EGI FJ00015]|uniref:DMT family transporter n=1 Tax=Lutimaribacter degradans TaxID=2945989 RepID=A0ACC5ZWK1_9RHOB|nr:DMT family transporter [Lutimaribacter sp. EGI FJ00013]MCM2562682.1 DMT family transporter [Lutimaribacter sp. EGI FJ00013]MCO0613839.1 DMT family transporter [Lutimaribacter sp. EGI FJ00015]MCO0636678.1 DMT family transporter [Lutimaribacter sp. EGI FJ00014]
MRLFLLISVTMLAFAGNSVLTRVAVAAGDAGPSSFAMVRLMAGAAILLILLGWRNRRHLQPRWRPAGAAMLALYVVGFSLAYRWLDAGLGALVLFGVVQLVMFAGALMRGEYVAPLRYAGAVLAMAGLAVLVWPQGVAAPDPLGTAMMAAAGLGWGMYSLRGQGVADPLVDTTWSFVWAVPAGVALFLAWPDGMTSRGFILAVLSGAVMSGLGYALWYQVLPRIAASTAALAQLTVPVIAQAGGSLFLSEPLSLRFALAAALVLGGVALGLRARRVKSPHAPGQRH